MGPRFVCKERKNLAWVYLSKNGRFMIYIGFFHEFVFAKHKI